MSVEIELDETPRTVEIPEALEQALAKDTAARLAFDALAFTHRKEFARWVAEAKTEDTRNRRIQQTIDRLKAGEMLR